MIYLSFSSPFRRYYLLRALYGILLHHSYFIVGSSPSSAAPGSPPPVPLTFWSLSPVTIPDTCRPWSRPAVLPYTLQFFSYTPQSSGTPYGPRNPSRHVISPIVNPSGGRLVHSTVPIKKLCFGLGGHSQGRQSPR